MSAQMVVPGLYQVSFGFVNAFILLDKDAVAIVDTGIPGSAPKILAALGELGRQVKDVRAILLTHLHADHTGSAKVLKEATGAEVYMHPIDAALFSQGQVMRPSQPAPGVLNQLLVSMFMRRARPMAVEPVQVDCLISDGDTLPIAGGLKVYHAPGHAAGQVVFLWPQEGGVLIAADACGNMFRLSYPPIFEDFEVGKRSLAKLAGLKFNHAVFGHGRPLHQADERFRGKWGTL